MHVKFMASSLTHRERAEVNSKDVVCVSSHLQLSGVNNYSGDRGQGVRLTVCWERAWASVARFCTLQSAAGVGWSTVMLCFGGEDDIFQQRIAVRHLEKWPSTCRTEDALVRTTPTAQQGESFVLNVV